MIAGERKTVELAMELAKTAGAKLAATLDRVALRDLRFPIVNHADAKLLRTAAKLKLSHLRQISSSIDWEDSINRMTA